MSQYTDETRLPDIHLHYKQLKFYVPSVYLFLTEIIEEGDTGIVASIRRCLSVSEVVGPRDSQSLFLLQEKVLGATCTSYLLCVTANNGVVFDRMDLLEPLL